MDGYLGDKIDLYIIQKYYADIDSLEYYISEKIYLKGCKRPSQLEDESYEAYETDDRDFDELSQLGYELINGCWFLRSHGEIIEIIEVGSKERIDYNKQSSGWKEIFHNCKKRGLAIFLSPDLKVITDKNFKDKLECLDDCIAEHEKYKKRITQDIIECTKAIEINEDNSGAYYRRGNYYSQQGNLMQAISDHIKAIEINPMLAKGYSRRTIFHRDSANEAISHYNKEIEADPYNAKSYNDRAVAYYAAKEYDKSWADIHKSVELGYVVNPTFINALKKASGWNM